MFLDIYIYIKSCRRDLGLGKRISRIKVNMSRVEDRYGSRVKNKERYRFRVEDKGIKYLE